MDDAELLDDMKAASTAPVVIVSLATLARLLVIAGYEGMAAHHAMVANRREMLEGTVNLTDFETESGNSLALEAAG